ncbi:MAG: hypothetical protein JSU61_12435 [Fidelibacterota bacterium]|nr:MAG: hypothetical protein JSU61_12435 [Candidatus Neomarinimicrobiota bacterium]
MTPRDIINQTLEFGSPPRVARSFHDSDMVSIRYRLSSRHRDWRRIREGYWERTDEWGNKWARLDATSRGQVVKGVLEDLDTLDAYQFPDYSQPESYQQVRNAREAQPDKWLIGELPGFTFGVAWRLLGLEQYMLNLLPRLAELRRLHDRIDALLMKMIARYAESGVDAVMIWEDWGTQDRLMIDPALWQKEFFPRFRTLCRHAHEHDIRVVMHSCGQVGDIIPGLIQAGIDVLQFDQPDLHGIDRLAILQQEYPVTYWCPVDIQAALQSQDEAIIRAKAREMLDKLWRGRGGFIAGYYDDNPSIGLDPEWQEYACDEFVRHGEQGNYN